MQNETPMLYGMKFVVLCVNTNSAANRNSMYYLYFNMPLGDIASMHIYAL